jgi:hypothetical protein
MLATDIVNIVESSGIAELARMYQLTPRAAQAYEVQARRALAQGRNPTLAPGDAVRASHGAESPRASTKSPTWRYRRRRMRPGSSASPTAFGRQVWPRSIQDLPCLNVIVGPGMGPNGIT